MPECRQLCDDEIQGYSLSRGHCKGLGGISTSIRLLLLNSVSIGGTSGEEKMWGIFFLFDLMDAWHCQ